MSFFFKNYSFVKVIYLSIRCYKTRLNKTYTHTHTHTHTPNWNGLVSMKIIDTPPLFSDTELLPFYGKNLNPLLIFENLEG